MSLTLRRATPADVEQIVEFNRRLAWESEAKSLDADVLTRGVTAILQDSVKGFYTLAESNGTCVGQAMITFEWSDWRSGWFWWIQSVYVQAESRGSGVFKTLFAYLHDQARHTNDVIGLRLYVERENNTAQEVYGKLGMATTDYELLELFPLH